MSFLIRLNNTFKSSTETAKHLGKRFQLAEKYKGGMIERILNYWKQLGNDYKQVAIDTLNDCRENPIKGTVYGSLLASLAYMYKTNPKYLEFQDTLLSTQAEMVTVGPSVRNKLSYDHLERINNLQKEKLLQNVDFIFFSVIFRREFAPQTNIYKANCNYVKPTYMEYLLERVEDVGFLGKWWIINEKFKDFDVNEEEWQ